MRYRCRSGRVVRNIEEVGMAKQLRCADVGFACDATINAEDEDAVMAQAAQHVKQVHGLTDQELQRQDASIRTAIRDA